MNRGLAIGLLCIGSLLTVSVCAAQTTPMATIYAVPGASGTLQFDLPLSAESIGPMEGVQLVFVDTPSFISPLSNTIEILPGETGNVTLPFVISSTADDQAVQVVVQTTMTTTNVYPAPSTLNAQVC